MSVDLDTVRTGIAQVVGRIAEVTTVENFEPRDINTSQLPQAAVWRDPVVAPGPGDVQGEFGNIIRTFTWQVRVYVRLQDDVAAQRDTDRITVGLVEQFELDPNLLVAGVPAVDQAAVTQITPQPILDTDPPLIMLEATVETVITWAP